MRAVLAAVAALIVGLVLGVGSAALAIQYGANLGRVANGQWSINLNAGSVGADPYTRATIARIGLLALNRSETIYFSRSTDDAGAPLREGCSYRIAGLDAPARWWSVTLYAHDQFLAQNEDAAHSFDATSIVRAVDGGYEALAAGARGQEANFLSTQGAGRFILMIRLYNPDPAALERPTEIALPSVSLISCQEGAA